MKQLLSTAGAAVKRLWAGATALYQHYPARGNALVAGAVVAGLGYIGVTVDLVSVKAIVAFELPILAAGEATHRKVTPVRRRKR